ncbi:hypothetical protein EVAR_31069_1 [Eumeta japonica]|uniref:Uncharacterized protein n=1 Tax=Eumeta variegata TaxID=151549 RepID=A0A4C1XCY4_EUMVA|nr:hypothetical protein EVAR_31069_1 [Eumeta japonica]
MPVTYGRTDGHDESVTVPFLPFWLGFPKKEYAKSIPSFSNDALTNMTHCLYDLKEYECGLRMDELSVKCLLYADDQVILAPSACGLQEMVNKLNDSVKNRGVKVNVGKAKVMLFEGAKARLNAIYL